MQTPASHRLARQLIAKVSGMAVVFATTLFVPAGTLDWPAGWIFLVLFFAFVVALSLWLFRFDPGLLAERMTGIGKSDQKTWDKVLLVVASVAFFGWLAIMGLDARFGWSRTPLWLQVLGAFILVGSFDVFFVTFRENTFLSPAVRVQSERTQAGFVLFTFSTSLLLGSWYGLAGALMLVALVAQRAVMEERVLRDELNGYAAYMAHVRYRLVPYVW